MNHTKRQRLLFPLALILALLLGLPIAANAVDSGREAAAPDGTTAENAVETGPVAEPGAAASTASSIRYPLTLAGGVRF